MSTAAVKSEPLDDVAMLPADGDAAQHGGSIELDGDGDDGSSSSDDDDPIVREIDVCLSPDLAHTISLVQFPLRPSNPNDSRPIASQGRHGKTAPAVTHHPLPEAARIKPRHGILELDFAPPRTTIEAASSLRSLPDALSGALRRRTFSSHAVPLRTHMALGKMNASGTRLDLIPLSRVVQMRPVFTHLDDPDEDDIMPKPESKDGNAKPLTYKRLESERSLALKRSSYAFKTASEEGEEWSELDVCGNRAVEKTEYSRRVVCPNPERKLELAAAPKGLSGNEAYVKSLNYLVQEIGMDPEEEEKEAAAMDGDDKEDGDDDDDADAGEEDAAAAEEDLAARRRSRDLTAKVASVLQRGGGGTPVPFPVLRSRFSPRDASDDALAVAASACAVLVRGNFVLRSALLGLSSEDADARDVVLLLLERYGRVRREPLVKMFGELTSNEEEYGEVDDADGGGKSGGCPTIDADVVNAILEGVTEATENSMELRVEDDAGFAARFPGVAELHRQYWERRAAGLEEFVDRYEELAELPSAPAEE